MSSSSPNNNILLVGIGSVGIHVLRASQDSKYNGKLKVFVLLRQETINSTDDKKKATVDAVKNYKNVTIIKGDIKENDEKDLVEILKLNNINTIVSTVSMGGWEYQEKLITAAKQVSSVKLFIPSEFGGFSSDRVGELVQNPQQEAPFFYSLGQVKEKIREAVKASKIDYLFIVTGAFTDYIFAPFGGYIAANNTLEVVGSLETRISGSTLHDIGYNTIELILSNTRNQTVHIATFDVSYAEIAKGIEDKTGKQLTIKITSESTIREEIKTNSWAVFKLFVLKNIGVSSPVDKNWNVIHKTGYQSTLKEAIAQSNLI